MMTQEFQAAVNARSTGPTREADLVGIIDELATRTREATRKAAEIGLAGAEIAGLRKRLVREAEARWMRTRYATLDLSFTHTTQRFVIGRTDADPSAVEMKRKVAPGEDPEVGKTEAVVSLPVFASEWNQYAALRGRFTESDRSWFRWQFRCNAGTLPRARINGLNYQALHVQAHAKMPDGIDPKMFARIRRCMAFLHLFDVMTLDRELADMSERAEQTIRIGVLWAPADDAWAFSIHPPRPAGDPAILLTRGGECYLVGYFDTPDEKPIDNLIREFSTGPLGVL